MLSKQHSTSIQSQLIFTRIVILVEIIRNSIGNIKNRIEDNLTLGVEMYPIHGRIGLSAYTFVEINIILFINIVLISQPKCLVYVNLFVLPYFSFYFLFFLLFCLLFHFKILILVSLSFCLNSFFLNFLLIVDINREIDEL
jgi:hypothetical protein